MTVFKVENDDAHLVQSVIPIKVIARALKYITGIKCQDDMRHTTFLGNIKLGCAQNSKFSTAKLLRKTSLR